MMQQNDEQNKNHQAGNERPDNFRENFNALWEYIVNFSSMLKDEDDVLIVSHHDADGVTSCAIMYKLFKELGINFDFATIKQLESGTLSDINKLLKEKNLGTVVFTDMGSGQIDMIESEISVNNFYIIDHHAPLREHAHQLNPHFFGFDGGKDVSGSGMCYFVSKAAGYTDMADIAIVGAVGDMQDSTGKLGSLNRIILDDGVEKGLLTLEYDLRFFGRQTRSIAHLLTYASDPVIPGITGNFNASVDFIMNLEIPIKKNLQDNLTGNHNENYNESAENFNKIEPGLEQVNNGCIPADSQWRRYIDLTGDEKQKLRDAIYIELVKNNTPEFLLGRVFGEVYTLTREREGTELRDAKEFATMMNACGRQDQSEIGVHVCTGDRNRYLQIARNLLKKHRRALREGLNYLSSINIIETDAFYYFDGSGVIEESIIGVIAGMAYGAKIIPSNKPVIAIATDSNNADQKKISSRATWHLVHSGINLGAAMRESSGRVGGEGGGHDIAAGATIAAGKVDEFISYLDEEFKRQKEKG